MTIDTIPMPLEPWAPSSSFSRPFVNSVSARHALPIVFTGSGSEYFRIWAVNLLLTLVTLGLYHPWAKVRRLRYFYGNTTVGGHPLDFHGQPRRMLRGFLLVGALVLLYSLAGKVSAIAGLLALAVVAVVWPALFRASQQFRLANTSWRGLRFRFTGGLAGAYLAMLPLFVPGVLAVGAVLFAETGQPAGALARFWMGLASIAGVASLLLAPLLFWWLKKYQHDHLAIGQVQTRFEAGPGAFYALALKTLGIVLAAFLVAGVLAALVAGFGTMALLVKGGSREAAGTIAAVVALLLAGYAAVALVVVPYLTSRLQNLVWGRTSSALLQFESRLRFWPLLRLTFKNWALVLLTLGLYLPFAKIAMARMRLEAVCVQALLEPDLLVGSLREHADDATGDAAGDLFGIDIGL